MNRVSVCTVVVFAVAGAALASPAQQSKKAAPVQTKKKAAPARKSTHVKRSAPTRKTAAASLPVASPKPPQQFVTVDEFVKARCAYRTPVSVEGYAVFGYKESTGSLLLTVIDSVDHVLNADDAIKMSAGAPTAILPSQYQKAYPGWAWDTKAMKKYTMYAGAGRPQTELHDVIEKLRLTGWVGASRLTINPVSKIEFMDPDGNWKVLK